MKVTYYSSRYWGFLSTPEQHAGWKLRAASCLSNLFPDAEVRVVELDEPSMVGFDEALPYSEAEVLEILQKEWESYIGGLR